MDMKKFTIIELLVVISIIALLASMLIPALSRAKYEARKVSHMGNMKQMTLGFLNYSNDNNSTMPQFLEVDYLSVNSGHHRESNTFMYNASSIIPYDWRTSLEGYGIMPATVNVITNLPAFDDPGNTYGSYLRMSWHYQVGNNYSTFGEVVSPNKVQLAGGENVILSDVLRQSPSSQYYGTFGKGGTRYSYESSGEASWGVKRGLNPIGVYATYYDGSVQWVIKGDMDVYLRSNGYYHWYVPNE